MVVLRYLLLTVFVTFLCGRTLAWSSGSVLERGDVCSVVARNAPDSRDIFDPVADLESADDGVDDDSGDDLAADDAVLAASARVGMPGPSGIVTRSAVPGLAASLGFSHALFRPPRVSS